MVETAAEATAEGVKAAVAMGAAGREEVEREAAVRAVAVTEAAATVVGG